jgi:hypothetical protein
LLKTFQRLGYFVPSKEVPEAIIEHIATVIKRVVSQSFSKSGTMHGF